jgi:tRNA U55 pseudouridine synthase TruB
MITGSHINIEQKYQPARSIESVHRFFAASNHDHFAHVEMDDRRFVFLSVSDIHQQDATYFAQLATTLQDPSAVGAFLHHLQGLELRSFNVRQKPNTNQHLLQKIKSLQGVARYWYEVLLAGDLDAGTNQFSAGSTWTEQMFTPTSDLVRHYTTFNKNAQRHQTVQSGDVLSTVQKLCPSAVTARQLCYQYGQSKKVQKRGLQLPDLKTARLEFEQAIGGAIRWI